MCSSCFLMWFILTAFYYFTLFCSYPLQIILPPQMYFTFQVTVANQLTTYGLHFSIEECSGQILKPTYTGKFTQELTSSKKCQQIFIIISHAFYKSLPQVFILQNGKLALNKTYFSANLTPSICGAADCVAQPLPLGSNGAAYKEIKAEKEGRRLHCLPGYKASSICVLHLCLLHETPLISMIAALSKCHPNVMQLILSPLGVSYHCVPLLHSYKKTVKLLHFKIIIATEKTQMCSKSLSSPTLEKFVLKSNEQIFFFKKRLYPS